MASVPKPNDNGQSIPVSEFANRTAPPPAAAPDPFDPAALRLSQDFAATIGVRKVVTAVPCHKPPKHEFVRVRAGEDWRLETAILEDKPLREAYLVSPAFRSEIPSEITMVCLFVAITRQGKLFLWPTKLPGPDGRSNLWNDSALAGALLAQEKWVRVSANMSAGMYDVHEAAGELAEPSWPDLSFRDVLELAFKGRFITSHDHPVLRALRGEV